MSRLYYLILLLLGFSITQCRQDTGLFPDPAIPQGPQSRVRLLVDTLDDRAILVIGEPTLKFYTAFYHPAPTDESRAFRAVQDSLPVVMADAHGNYYNVWGDHVSGPDAGEHLKPANSMIAYWFAWGAFFPGCAIYDHPDIAAPDPPPGDNDWLIPYSRLNQGALPGTIPAIDAPEYIEHITEYMPYLEDETLCLAIRFGKEVFVFPHPVLEWHEVVNDVQANIDFSVLYCPLTGSGCAWKHPAGGPALKFEVSGLLYNSNLITYERNSGSYWSQMQHQAVAGSQKGQAAETIQVFEVPLATARRLFGRFKVLSDKTPYDLEYGNFPCGDYCTNHNLILYSLFFDDPRIPRKERIFGVQAGGKAKVYRASAFE
ncbi:MAG: DUF3179 domain-containing protein [Bacteroidetes bacterium]|nr:MAG: DUF3179 domain-containing protein [Bacteroidota bacterium]